MIIIYKLICYPFYDPMSADLLLKLQYELQIYVTIINNNLSMPACCLFWLIVFCHYSHSISISHRQTWPVLEPKGSQIRPWGKWRRWKCCYHHQHTRRRPREQNFHLWRGPCEMCLWCWWRYIQFIGHSSSLEKAIYSLNQTVVAGSIT